LEGILFFYLKIMYLLQYFPPARKKWRVIIFWRDIPYHTAVK